MANSPLNSDLAIAALATRDADLARARRIGKFGRFGRICGFEVDLGTMTARRSPAYRALHGLAADVQQEAHDAWLARLHPDDRERVSATLAATLKAGGSRYECEYRIVLAGGQTRWIVAIGEIERDPAGRPARLIGMHQDVTERMRIERKLRHSEAIHRAAFDGSPVGMNYVSPDRRITQVNNEFCTITGYPANELIGMTIAELTHPQDRAADAAGIVALLSGQTSRFQSEKRYLRKDGSTCWVAVAVQLIRDDRNRVLHSVSVVQDISAQKKTQGERERYRLLFSHSQEIILFIHSDGRILEANQAAVNTYGYSHDELLAASVYDLRSPDTRDGVAMQLHRAESGPVVFETIHRRKDGSQFPVEVSSSNAYADGEPVIMSIVRDMTERHRVQQRLQASEALFRACFEQSAVGMAQLSATTGRFVQVNQKFCDMTGYSADELLQLSPGDITFADDRSADDQTNGQLLRGEILWREAEKRYVSKSGRIVWVHGNASLLRDAQGRPERSLGVVQDITERKRTQQELSRYAEQLANANRHKDEFLAMLAHELRNPLAPIRNAVEILRAVAPDEPRVQQMRAIVERQVAHLARLVDDLMDVSRVTQGRIALEKVAVDLNQVIAAGIELARPQIDARGHELRVVADAGESLWVEGDAVRLAQVVGNLLNNAAKYTEPSGTIELTLTRGPDHAQLTIRDNGMGITPELQAHVFDLFTQAERSPDRSQGGLGIGLALVKSLVELHGGQVRVYSDGPGQGCQFTVSLPLSPLRPAATGESGKGRVGAFKRVLIVDDNVDSADSLGALLELQGHSVRCVYDGLAAIAAAIDFAPEVIILDIGLPGIDGYEVARRLRKAPGTRDVALIALTGYGQQADQALSQAAGFDHHLVKPVQPQVLIALIDSLSTPHRR